MLSETPVPHQTTILQSTICISDSNSCLPRVSVLQPHSLLPLHVALYLKDNSSMFSATRWRSEGRVNCAVRVGFKSYLRHTPTVAIRLPAVPKEGTSKSAPWRTGATLPGASSVCGGKVPVRVVRLSNPRPQIHCTLGQKIRFHHQRALLGPRDHRHWTRLDKLPTGAPPRGRGVPGSPTTPMDRWRPLVERCTPHVATCRGAGELAPSP